MNSGLRNNEGQFITVSVLKLKSRVNTIRITESVRLDNVFSGVFFHLALIAPSHRSFWIFNWPPLEMLSMVTC